MISHPYYTSERGAIIQFFKTEFVRKSRQGKIDQKTHYFSPENMLFNNKKIIMKKLTIKLLLTAVLAANASSLIAMEKTLGAKKATEAII